MFTGIIETLGIVTDVRSEQRNVHFTVASPLSGQLKVDQSVSHNGACLTVVATTDGTHVVTAVAETLRRTNLGNWEVGSLVNLERCMPLGGRLDGHLVQGHVDGLATCVGIEDMGGSWQLTFEYPADVPYVLVDKGSICVNGISLTVVNPVANRFTVAIIPYTWENTNLHQLRVGDSVNLEFDMIGKYIGQYMAAYQAKWQPAAQVQPPAQ